MSSNGSARRFPPTRSPCCTDWRAIAAPRNVLGDDVDIDIVGDRRNQHAHSAGAHRARDRAAAAAGLFAWSACNRTSFRTPSIWRGDFAPAACRSPSAASTSPAASRCCREMPDDLDEAQALGVSLFAGEAEGRLETVLRDAFAGRLKPLYNFMKDLPGHRGRADSDAAGPTASSAPRASSPASTPGAAARSNARSAPSSTCRAASRAIARPTTSRRSFAPISRRASIISSSPTTISPATRTGSRSSIG